MFKILEMWYFLYSLCNLNTKIDLCWKSCLLPPEESPGLIPGHPTLEMGEKPKVRNQPVQCPEQPLRSQEVTESGQCIWVSEGNMFSLSHPQNQPVLCLQGRAGTSRATP